MPFVKCIENEVSGFATLSSKLFAMNPVPRSLKLLLSLFVLSTISISGLSQDPQRFEKEVTDLVSAHQSIDKTDLILFTGSSSIRMWKDIETTFSDHNVLNLGFGGSQMEDLLFYFDKLILPYNPKQIFIYEGDNDISSGKSSDEILHTAEQLLTLIRDKVSGTVDVFFITPKPSIARWPLKSKYEEYNHKLDTWANTKKGVEVIDVWTPMLDKNGVVFQDIFIADGLHLNSKGYKIWSTSIKPYLK